MSYGDIMAKIIEFPESKINIEKQLLKKYEGNLKEFPPHIADCLKLSLSLLLERGKVKTPELKIMLNSNMKDNEIKEVITVLKKFHESNREMLSTLLQEIATLNLKICVMKHQLLINDIVPDVVE